MYPFFPRVSDESLFIQASMGDKEAFDALYHRCEHIGRQIAGAVIRQKGISYFTDQDFISVINDAILKIFRYYTLNELRFEVYVKEIMGQHIGRAVTEAEIEVSRRGDPISLDQTIHFDSQFTFHEVVPLDPSLNAGQIYDINCFLENLSSSNSPKRRLIAKIYLLHEMGYTLTEISKKVKRSRYIVRNIINNFNQYLDGTTITIKMR